MDRLIDYLIDGRLIAILDAGRDHLSIAWIHPDETAHPHPFRLYYEPCNHTDGPRIGGQPTPTQAIRGSRVISAKQEEVADYLVLSFSLTREQANRVINEARRWQAPPPVQ